QRQTERDRLRNDRNLFPQSESRKAPQAGLSDMLGQLVLPCIPTSSPRLVTQLLLNLKSEEEGWRRVLFHSCPCFFPSPSSPRLSVQHETGPQPQTGNADNINFLLFSPVGNKRLRKKSTLVLY
ncbi:hypothetical protein XENOCAPTIV_028962, partial [Xenoophorus captivus]